MNTFESAFSIFRGFLSPEVNLPMLVDLSQFNNEPYLIRAFVYADRENSGRIACVCKKWRALIDAPLYYIEMWKRHKSKVLGEKVWKRYYGDPGEVLPIPDTLRSKYCRFPSALIWIPNAVLRPGMNQPQVLDLRTIEQWSSHPLPDSGGSSVSYDGNVEGFVADSIGANHEGRWALIGTQVMKDRNYAALEKYAFSKGAEISGALSTITWLFLEKVRGGKIHLTPDHRIHFYDNVIERLDYFDNEFGYMERTYTYVLNIGITPQGIRVKKELKHSWDLPVNVLPEWSSKPPRPLRHYPVQYFSPS